MTKCSKEYRWILFSISFFITELKNTYILKFLSWEKLGIVRGRQNKHNLV